MISVEKNIFIRELVRSDFRRGPSALPSRVFYKRGAWRPRGASDIEYVGEVEAVEGGGVLPVPGVPEEIYVEWAAINIASAATHTIVGGAVGRKIRISFLTFTVGDEVNITLYDGSEPISGPMDFGGLSEPRGIVLPADGNYLELDYNTDFCIALSAAVQVSGFCLFSRVL